MQWHSLLELVKKAMVSSLKKPRANLSFQALPPPPRGPPECWREGSSAPTPQLGLERSSRGFQVPWGLRPTPLAHLGALAAQEEGKFGVCWPRLPVLPGRSISSGWPSRPGPASPRPPTYWAGARAPRVGAKWFGRTHFWERWPLPLGAGERILRGGRRKGTGSGGRIGRRRGAKRGGKNGGVRSCGVPKSRSAPSSRHRDARGLAQVPAAAPTVRAPAALQAEGGELRWRDARPVPASSSARPGARAALVRCGGGPRARRPGLAVREAAAASCLPGATSEPQAEEPGGGASPPTPGPAAPPRRAARAASAGLGPLWRCPGRLSGHLYTGNCPLTWPLMACLLTGYGLDLGGKWSLGAQLELGRLLKC